MNIDTVIRWWVVAATVIAPPTIGNLLENLAVLSPAPAMTDSCKLPLLTLAVLPRTGYLTEAGLVIAAISLLVLIASFRLAQSEVGRYRATTIVSLFTLVAVLVVALQVLLALFVLPIAKCGA